MRFCLYFYDMWEDKINRGMTIDCNTTPHMTLHFQYPLKKFHINFLCTRTSGTEKVSGQERLYRKNSRFHTKILPQRKFTKIQTLHRTTKTNNRAKVVASTPGRSQTCKPGALQRSARQLNDNFMLNYNFFS